MDVVLSKVEEPILSAPKESLTVKHNPGPESVPARQATEHNLLSRPTDPTSGSLRDDVFVMASNAGSEYSLQPLALPTPIPHQRGGAKIPCTHPYPLS
jgi:hypothetical protein